MTKLEGGHSSDLLITSIEMISRLDDIHVRVIQANTDKKLYTYRSIKSGVSKDLLSAKDGLGVVTKEVSTRMAPKLLDARQRPAQVTDNAPSMVTTKQINWAECLPVQQLHLNGKSKLDKNDCTIAEMAFIHPNTLLLVDDGNYCVKRVNTDTGAITCYLSLPSFPWDITTLCLNQAAVTLPDMHSIQIISTKPDLSLLRTIKVDGYCYGICSTTDNKLVVTYVEPGRVQVMDGHGNVLCEMGIRADTKLAFSFPHYVIAVTENEKEVIYVSDNGTNLLTKLSMTGQVLLTYRDDDLQEPGPVSATDDGHVLICGAESNNVQVVSMSGKKVCTLLCKKNELDFPRGVCYNDLTKTMYVNCRCSSKIMVFKLQK